MLGASRIPLPTRKKLRFVLMRFGPGTGGEVRGYGRRWRYGGIGDVGNTGVGRHGKFGGRDAQGVREGRGYGGIGVAGDGECGGTGLRESREVREYGRWADECGGT